MGTLKRKEAKSKKICTKRAKLKALAGHICPAGRMLCMPELDKDKNRSKKMKMSKKKQKNLGLETFWRNDEDDDETFVDLTR